MPARRRKGWRGPEFDGDFPTLGWLLGDWIQENCIIPAGAGRGRAYVLTDEMWSHLAECYRLHPDATVDAAYPQPVDGRVYVGSQLRRSQKWGKDPLMAVKLIAHAFGPAQFAGWDGQGEPVGRPVDTPWVQIAATSDEQTKNTYAPVYRNLTEGPLANIPGLDVGVTSTKLPDGDGWIEPVTTAARSRLGQPITHATFTEPHLLCAVDGGLHMVRAMKRGLSGMGGDWQEGTNAWDPKEKSAAQLTAEDKAPDVFLDHRAVDLPNLSLEEFADDAKVRERIVVKYGDSCRTRGGWVNEERILSTIRMASTGESEARRYFLDELWVGSSDAVTALRWNALARPQKRLLRGDAVALGFDGSRTLDYTALKACRISDGHWFTLGLWKPSDYPSGRVPESDVDQAVDDANEAYQLWHLIADPYKWESSLDRWAGRLGNNPAGKPIVVILPTTNERKMDDAIVRWQTCYRIGEGEFTHDGHPVADAHAFNSAIALGKRKPPRDEVESNEDAGVLPEHYQRIVRKLSAENIDDFIAGLLASKGRSLAIEHGALEHNGRSAYEDSGLTVV